MTLLCRSWQALTVWVVQEHVSFETHELCRLEGLNRCSGCMTICALTPKSGPSVEGIRVNCTEPVSAMSLAGCMMLIRAANLKAAHVDCSTLWACANWPALSAYASSWGITTSSILDFELCLNMPHSTLSQ